MLKSLDNISINCQSSIKISDGLTIYFDPYDIKEKVSNADNVINLSIDKQIEINI